MYRGNRGYDGKSMSVRARKAYQKGLLSFSKIQAKHLKEKDIDISLSFFRWLVEKEYIKPTEWHHTSKYFNRTNFFSLDHIQKQVKRLDITTLRRDYERGLAQTKRENGYYAKIQYEEWYGSQKTGGYITCINYAYVYKGWVHFTANRKKKLNNNRLQVVERYEEKPADMQSETDRDIQAKLQKV